MALMWSRLECIFVLAIILSASLSADDRFSMVPSISVDEVREDNLFLTASARVSDSIVRISPGLSVDYRTPLAQMNWRYTFDTERYANHPALSTPWARQNTQATFSVTPTDRLIFGTTAAYYRTHTPQELNITTALATERGNAERWGVTPSVTYRMSSRNQGTVSYSYTRDFTTYAVAGSTTNETHSARIAFDRKLTSSDSAIVEYQIRRFAFSDSRSGLSHVLMTGWARQISNRTDITLHVGPRIAAGRLAPEATLALSHKRRQGDVSVEYARSESLSLGQIGTVGFQRLAVSLAARPGHGFELHVTDGLVKNASAADGLNALIYTIDIDATKAFGAWLALSAGFHGTVQRGTVAFIDSTIPHSVMMVRLVAGRQR